MTSDDFRPDMIGVSDRPEPSRRLGHTGTRGGPSSTLLAGLSGGAVGAAAATVLFLAGPVTITLGAPSEPRVAAPAPDDDRLASTTDVSASTSQGEFQDGAIDPATVAVLMLALVDGLTDSADAHDGVRSAPYHGADDGPVDADTGLLDAGLPIDVRPDALPDDRPTAVPSPGSGPASGAPTTPPTADPTTQGPIEVAGIRAFEHEGHLWSQHVATGNWWRMPLAAGAVELEQIAVADVPRIVREGLAPRPSSATDAVDTTAAGPNTAGGPDAASERPPARAGEAEQGELLINAKLAEPARAAAVLAVLDALPGFDRPGDVSADRPVIAFFDPTCPHCHSAFTALDGRVAVRWIPTMAVSGRERASARRDMARLLGEMRLGDASDDGPSRAVFSDRAVEAAEARSERLDEALRTGNRTTTHSSADDGAAQWSAAHERAIHGNEEALLLIYRDQLDLAAVPTLVVPGPDGTARVHRGPTPDDVDAIVADLAALDPASDLRPRSPRSESETTEPGASADHVDDGPLVEARR